VGICEVSYGALRVNPWYHLVRRFKATSAEAKFSSQYFAFTTLAGPWSSAKADGFKLTL